MITLYESAAEACRDAKARYPHETHLTAKDHWYGPDSFARIQSMAEAGGDERCVPAAERLLTKLEAEFPETLRTTYEPSIAGGVVIVPDYLAGIPECMRLRTPALAETAPIKLGVLTTISSNVSQEAFEARAVATLAILMQLVNSGRAVELWGLNCLHGREGGETVIATKVATPLSLADAGLVLANIGFTRRLYALGEANGFNGGWPVMFDTPCGVEYAAGLAKRMGFQMILPALYGSEAKQVLADPLAWSLARYREIQARIGEASE
jgi:hypothetical protein